MKLRANAAMFLRTRRVLCERARARLLDRPSAPHRVANRTDERRVQAIAASRRLRFSGPEIAEAPAMPLSTVSHPHADRNGPARVARPRAR